MANAKFCTKCGKELVNGKCENCDSNESPKYSNNGYINRVAIKDAARKKMEGNLWNLLKPLLVGVLIGFIAGVVSAIFGEKSAVTYFVELASEILMIPITAGMTLYYLNFVRGKEFNINDLFTYFDKRFFNLLLISIVVGLFTFLWSLLFIIPGIIAAIGYSMCTYIYVDNDNMEVMDVLKTSKSMMEGHKMEYFTFMLSFIGWVLLSIITFGIAAIYAVPYMTLAQTMYYDELRLISNNKGE